MKACKFCGTQVNDDEQHCSSCGSTQFLRVCENCGSTFESAYCPNCGVKAGQKKKVCPECKTVYFCNACPNCGYTPSRKPVVQEVVHKHVYVEPEPEPQPDPEPVRPARYKGKGCGCLIWIIVIIIIAGMFSTYTGSKKSTTKSTKITVSTKTTAQVTKDPSITAAPTATPEPAIAAAQEIVDQYFANADDSEIAAVKEADSAFNQYEAKDHGKIIVVRRSWSRDRGLIGTSKLEPDYVSELGYAAVFEDQNLEKDSGFGTTPWQVPVYRKDKQFWEKAGTIDHKTEVVVIGQELTMPTRTYSTSRCSGYLHVIRMDTGTDCWLDVENFVAKPYWENNLTEAQEKGYCIAEFRQISDYYPVTKGKDKTALDDGTLVLLPIKSSLYSSSPDKENNPVAGIVFKEWKLGFGGVTVFFNADDLTLIY